jgi:sugar transporter
MYLLIFYTNVYGLKPEVAAVMFLIVRIVDIIWDPLVGAFVDKHNPKLGKYRSYLILGGIPLTDIFYKAGMALGGVVPGLVMAFVGFDQTNEVSQSPFAEQGILWLVTVIPALLLLVAMFIISKYGLEDDVIDNINREIELRHKGGE